MVIVMTRVALLVATAIALGACADNDCAPVTYSCEPVPEGSPGCVGGPLWHPHEASDDFMCHADVDKVFPAGCSATIAETGHFGSNRMFSCIAGRSFAWHELL